MINIQNLKSTYICFNSNGEFISIMKEFKRLWFTYKNGSIEDATNKVNNSTVNKVICHDEFVLTSKEKVTTMSCKVFLNLASSLTSKSELVSNNNTNPNMSNTNGIKGTVNRLKAKRLFSDEKYVEGLLEKAEWVADLASNFIATLEKAEDKANRLADLGASYADAIDAEDCLEIERLEKLISSVEDYVTKTNKVLSEINSTGAKIIKADTKCDKEAGKTFIGD